MLLFLIYHNFAVKQEQIHYKYEKDNR